MPPWCGFVFQPERYCIHRKLLLIHDMRDGFHLLSLSAPRNLRPTRDKRRE